MRAQYPQALFYLAQEQECIASMLITRSAKPPKLMRKEPNALDEETRKRRMGGSSTAYLSIIVLDEREQLMKTC